MKKRINQIRRAAPLFALVILTAMCFDRNRNAIPKDVSAEYRAAVAAASQEIPYRIGKWVGKDSQPLPAAIKLLRPNVIVQRTYFHPQTMETISLLFVHCADIRDMAGHYPPICYPSHGWIQTRDDPLDLALGDENLAARLYEFRWPATSVRPALQIMNFFVAPGDAPVIARDMDGLRDDIRPGVLSSLGVGQFQLVSSATVAPTQRDEVVTEVMTALRPLIEVVGTFPGAMPLEEDTQ